MHGQEIAQGARAMHGTEIAHGARRRARRRVRLGLDPLTPCPNLPTNVFLGLNRSGTKSRGLSP
eukprot:3005286-Rhodomonas_salina.1